MPIRSNLAFQATFPICSVCSEPVELDTAKVNEVGNPIHEECYVVKDSLRKATTLSLKSSSSEAIAPPPNGEEQARRTAIVSQVVRNVRLRPPLGRTREAGNQPTPKVQSAMIESPPQKV
jgi:hypothetical protein